MLYHEGYAGSIHNGSAKLGPNNLKQANKCPGSKSSRIGHYTTNTPHSEEVTIAFPILEVEYK
jgi:hypothetical protein